MPYKERLNRWAIVRLLADKQQVTVAQFRSRADADGRIEIIRRLSPQGRFLVVFNPDLQSECEAEPGVG